MLDIDLILRELAGERPAFHSEADFQHALAWRIHSKLPETEIRLEVPMALPGGERRLHVDVLVDGTCAIELKYKTRKSEYAVGEERFVLRNHGAQDFGRYDFLKDIERLERVVLEGPCTVGYAIMLTNDDYYWKGTDSDTMDAAFRIGGGQTIGGTLQWADPERPWLKGRNKSITLKGEYTLSWKDYSPLGFRRVVAEVSQERLRSS
jgi:hypothetical protein